MNESGNRFSCQLILGHDEIGPERLYELSGKL